MDVQELVQSIVASGYFEHEPLIVAQEEGHYVVIEGNRRLAAVKILLDRELANQVGCKIRVRKRSDLEELEALPVTISSREDSWRYLGFKHVNGPVKWSSYAKAQYIADIQRQYGVSLPDIAEQIGDRHKTVQRLFRGLMVMEQAEEAGVFNREDRFRTRFAFSHLYTGLDYEGIGEFLSLGSADVEHERPVPRKALKKLGELCVWLYGSKRDSIQPVIQSQNPDLRDLDTVLKNKESIAALRNGVPLVKALEAGREPEAVLEDALLDAKRALQHASGYVTIGFKKSKTITVIAGDVLTWPATYLSAWSGECCCPRKGCSSAKEDGHRPTEGSHKVFKLPNLPSPRAGVQELADFVEIRCWIDRLKSGRKELSEIEVARYLIQADDNEMNDGCNDDEDAIRDRVSEAMIEIGRRSDACRGGYPFVQDSTGQTLRVAGRSKGRQQKKLIYICCFVRG